MAFAPPRKKEVDAAFDSVDTNNDGVIDRREFMACQKLHSMQNLIAPKVKFQSKNLYLIDLHVSAEQLLRPAFLSGEKEFLIEPPCLALRFQPSPGFAGAHCVGSQRHRKRPRRASAAARDPRSGRRVGEPAAREPLDPLQQAPSQQQAARARRRSEAPRERQWSAAVSVAAPWRVGQSDQANGGVAGTREKPFAFRPEGGQHTQERICPSSGSEWLRPEVPKPAYQHPALAGADLETGSQEVSTL